MELFEFVRSDLFFRGSKQALCYGHRLLGSLVWTPVLFSALARLILDAVDKGDSLLN